ncbi:hypothetical protein O7602_20995 [Micromonospora sp. WMMD1128]|uniref:hypothetical protein n=1 Tax=Micromonospora sp. WMMD1128 TaxID=3015150 RepID=UPI00248C32E6|nr:hypothetical protein [Micromonospora sp. WMMD1128]WBB72180.1 hypothetical protein O7602_20995 [Micromonospora sp. WMMD1128]
MTRWKWFQRDDEPVDVVQPATAYPDRIGAHATPPFAVIMAGYVLDFHHRQPCSRCEADGGCERLTRACETLRAWRDRTGTDGAERR